MKKTTTVSFPRHPLPTQSEEVIRPPFNSMGEGSQSQARSVHTYEPIRHQSDRTGNIPVTPDLGNSVVILNSCLSHGPDHISTTRQTQPGIFQPARSDPLSSNISLLVGSFLSSPSPSSSRDGSPLHLLDMDARGMSDPSQRGPRGIEDGWHRGRGWVQDGCERDAGGVGDTLTRDRILTWCPSVSAGWGMGTLPPSETLCAVPGIEGPCLGVSPRCRPRTPCLVR